MAASERAILSSLTQQTDQWFARACSALLSQIPCSPGCSHCCIGPFPITLLDVRLLQEGLSRLPTDQKERIEQCAREQVSAMGAGYPKLTESPYLDRWPDTEIDRLVHDFHRSPCPALGEDGRCEVYKYRPLACRSMGIPTEEAGVISGACDIQTFVPIVRLSALLRTEEDELAEREARALDTCRLNMGAEGEEVLLPYGFLPAEKPEGLPEEPSQT